MNVLLVIPRRDAYSILPAPDIGVAYIARAALNTGAKVEVLDAHKEKMGYDEFKHHLKKKRYDLIAFKCLSMDINVVLNYCRAVKEIDQKIITVLGGAHPSALPEHIMRSGDVDYVIRGEGELGFAALLNALMSYSIISSEDAGKIPCLVYRDGDNRIRINPVVFEEHPDRLDFPAWHLFKIKEYPQLPGGGGKFLPVITSRGCPSVCTFCSSNTIHGRTVRNRTPEHVIEEIKWIIKDFNVQKVSVYDNNFTFYKDHAVTFSGLYIKNNFHVKFDVPQGVRLDRIDKEVIKALHEAGCDFMGVGVESGDQETLNKVQKGTTLKMIEDKLKMIKENSDMKLSGFFILGFPHETEADVLKTIDFAVKLPLDYAAFTIFTPFPGTDLFEQMIREGYFSIDNIKWENLVLDKPTFDHRNVSAEKLKRLQRKAYIKFYFRPSKIKFFMRIAKEASFMSYLRRFISILKG